ASNTSMRRGSPMVTFISDTPAKWNVSSVICVPGSPMDSAATLPTASPGSTEALTYSSYTAARIFLSLLSFALPAYFFTSSMTLSGSLFSYSLYASAMIVTLLQALDDLLDVELACFGPADVEAVLAVVELHDLARRVAHCAVVLDFQVLHRVRQAAVQVAA